MHDIAVALSKAPGLRFAARTVGMFAACVCSLNVLHAAIWRTAPDLCVAVHVISWGGWFVWQGLVFPRARDRALAAPGPAYAAVFYTQILPGVCWGLSHMTAPVVAGFDASVGPSMQTVLGCLVLSCGFLLLASGFWTIGVARAGFLAEYTESIRPVLRTHVYSVVRHPLFVGGALASFGGTLAIAPDAIVIACINIAILPVYAMVEDRRLKRVFGSEYASYASTVGGIVPHGDRVIALLPGKSLQTLGRVSRSVQ